MKPIVEGTMDRSPACVDRKTEGRDFRQALPALFLLTSVFFLTFLSRIIFSPLLPLLEKELEIRHSQGASLFLGVSIGYVVTILLAPFLSVRIGNRKTIACAGVGCGLMLVLFSFCHTLASCQIVSVCVGLMAGLYLPSGMATIVELAPASYLTRGMAIHELAPNLGFVIAPLISSLLVSFFGWRTGVQLLGWMFVLWGAGYGWYGYDCTRLQQPLNLRLACALFRRILFWRITLMLCFAVSSTIGIYSMLPLLLVNEQSMGTEEANTLVAVSRLGSIIMPLVGGWLGDRFGNGRIVVAVLFVTGLLTVPLGFLQEWRLIACVILQPLIAVMFFPCCFALFATLGEQEQKGMAISLGIPIGFLVGGGVLPLLIGTIGDLFGLRTGVMTVGVMMSVVAVLAGSSRELLKRTRG